MGRKNRRAKSEYRKRLGFNPRKYIHGGNDYHSMNTTTERKTARQFMRIPQRGDIWFADLGEHEGTSVQSGCRPVVIISNNIGNQHSDTLNVLPMTRNMKKSDLPCHTELEPDMITDVHQMLDPSMILAEQITTISKSSLRGYVGQIVNETVLDLLRQTVSAQLGLENPSTDSHGRLDERSTAI